jgi:hypothetical protein
MLTQPSVLLLSTPGVVAGKKAHTNVRSKDLMEQRPLRLGDIVDDYCPRERRITNHAIVVITGADIHSTRCTACEAEHPYKHAKLPLRKAAEAHESGNGHLVKPAPEPVIVPAAPSEPVTAAMEAAAPVESAPNEEAAADSPPAETYHRPLIRAALPKGMVPAAPRPLPDFTMRNIRNRDGRDGRSNGRRFSR